MMMAVGTCGRGLTTQGGEKVRNKKQLPRTAPSNLLPYPRFAHLCFQKKYYQLGNQVFNHEFVGDISYSNHNIPTVAHKSS